MSRRWQGSLASTAVLAGLAFIVVLGWRDRGRFTFVGPGDEAPVFALPTTKGDTVRLDSFRGKVALLNIWATWCAPCVWEMPAMERVYRELGPKGFEVIAVSVDVGTDAAQANALVDEFVAEKELTFTVLRDPDHLLQRMYQADYVPTTFLIDRDGRIAHRLVGPAEWDREPHRSMILDLLER